MVHILRRVFQPPISMQNCLVEEELSSHMRWELIWPFCSFTLIICQCAEAWKTNWRLEFEHYRSNLHLAHTFHRSFMFEDFRQTFCRHFLNFSWRFNKFQGRIKLWMQFECGECNRDPWRRPSTTMPMTSSSFPSLCRKSQRSANEETTRPVPMNPSVSATSG